MELKIRELRLDRGMTQENLADESESSQSEVFLWENHRRTPRIESLIRVMKALNCTPNEMFRGDWLD